MIRNQLTAPTRRSSAGQSSTPKPKGLEIEFKQRQKQEKLSVEEGKTLQTRMKDTESKKAKSARMKLIDKLLGKDV